MTERLSLSLQVALVVKNLPANAGDGRDAGSISESGRCPGAGHGNPLQYSCLENPMDRRAQRSQSTGSQGTRHHCLPSTAEVQRGAHQALLSMGFSRQEYWSGLPSPSPGDLPDPGIKPGFPSLQADSILSEPPGKLSLLAELKQHPSTVHSLQDQIWTVLYRVVTHHLIIHNNWY